MLALQTSSGGNSEAFDVSHDGGVAVGVHSFGGTSGRVWTEGGITSVGELPHAIGNGNVATAFGVSGDGSVVVGHSPSGETGVEAFMWTSTDGIVGLGRANYVSTAWAASEDGSVIVGVSGSQAFRWTEADGIQGLGALAGPSFARDVSADGSVIVGTSSQAFRWTELSGLVGLGTLPGRAASAAEAVSSDGSVVAGYSYTGSGPRTPFIWHAAEGMRDLEVVLSAVGLDLTGWGLGEARGLSADGRTIVGVGTNPDGNTEAWIATIPEPGTAILVSIGLAGLAVRRRL
jgi:probable HAF family extracellular repeat protein